MPSRYRTLREDSKSKHRGERGWRQRANRAVSAAAAPQAPASGGSAGAGFSVTGEPVGSVTTPAA